MTRISRRLLVMVAMCLLNVPAAFAQFDTSTVLGAVREATRYGLYDLDRLERMILRRVTREYFLLDRGAEEDE